MKKKFRVRIDKERCKGCLLCISVCLRKILKLSKDLNSRGQHYSEISDQDACVGCQYCAQICPDAAIEIDRVVPAPAESTGEPPRGCPEQVERESLTPPLADTPGEPALVGAAPQKEAF